MPKHNFIMNLIRGIGSDSLKKIGQQAISSLGNIVLGAGSALERFAPSLAPKLVSGALSALSYAPKLLDTGIDIASGLATTGSPTRYADHVSPLFAIRGQGPSRGDGQLLFGNDQPQMRERAPVIKVDYVQRRLLSNQFAEELPRVEYTPPSGKQSFGKTDGAYLGDDNKLKSGARSDASEAGPMFRKVGRGTNIVGDAPGFGELVAKKKRKMKIKTPVMKKSKSKR